MTSLSMCVFFLLVLLMNLVSAQAQDNKELQIDPVVGPTACATNFSPYCSCEVSYPVLHNLGCTITKSEDFIEIRRMLKEDPDKMDYTVVTFSMWGTFEIPEDVLGGKRTDQFYLWCYSQSLGEINSNAFQFTSDFTTTIKFQNCDFRNYTFSFLSQLPNLKSLSLFTSNLYEMKDMPYLPNLDEIILRGTSNLTSWYPPSQTPNLTYIEMSTMKDLDDQKMESIMSSMTDGFIFPKLDWLSLSQNEFITRVPPHVLDFPSLTVLGLESNPIERLTTGSLNSSSTKLIYLFFSNMQLSTVEPGAFVGDYSNTEIFLSGSKMTSFPSSAFQDLLRSMVGNKGYVGIRGNPIADDCGLAWLLVDNRDLLPYVQDAAIANGTRFEDLNPTEYYNC